ncbi:MAG: nuclear transport factor 2 family protein, partial [Acidimicrobiales bacterium]
NHIRAERPRMAPDTERDRRLLDAFVAAVGSGDPAELERLLHDDVVLVSDGGAKARAARYPILGPSRVARFFVGVARKAPPGDSSVDYVTANGQLALEVSIGGRVDSLVVVEPDASGERIARLFLLRNPDKLRTFRQGSRFTS